MTFEELESKLPNGFHDARIAIIDIDFIKRVLRLEMSLHVGGASTEELEVYKPAMLSLSPFHVFYLEAPDSRYSFLPDGYPLNVDGDSVNPGDSHQFDQLAASLPLNSVKYRFFVEEWNSFIYLSGENLACEWRD